MFPLIRDMWIGKGQGLLLHLNYPIRKMYFAAAYSEHDLIKIPPFVGHGPGLVAHIRIQFEHVEMADLVADIAGYPVEFPLVEFCKRFKIVHSAILIDFKQS